MRIWKKGQTRRAICPKCEDRREVVFTRRDVSLDAPAVTARDVLVGACTVCDEVAVIPEQSAAKVRDAIENPKEILNVRIPGHLKDILYSVTDQVAHGWKGGNASVLKYLLHQFGSDPAFAKRVEVHLQDDLAHGPADSEVSVRVPTVVLLAVDQMAELLGIQSRSDVLRGVLATAKEDVLDGEDPQLTASMKRAIMAVA